MLRVSTGGIRNERELTEEEIQNAMNYAVSLGMPAENIRYSDTYYDTSHIVFLHSQLLGVIPENDVITPEQYKWASQDSTKKER